MANFAKERNEGREPWVDSLRGFAIFLMVPANLAPLMANHSFLFRLSSSLAAPIFLTLVGLMLAVSAQRHSLTYYVKRGALILACGAFVDIFAWGSIPFTYFDVLHLIGATLPIAYLFNKASFKSLAVVWCVVLLLTPVLQDVFGYTQVPSAYSLDGELSVDERLVSSGIVHHWLIDGFFPIFPWFGFIVLGILLQRLHWSSNERLRAQWQKTRAPIVSAGLFFGGCVIWSLFPGMRIVREGYSELFYNPTPGFVITATGACIFFYWGFFKSGNAAFLDILRVLGEASLFMYVFHLVMIGRIKAWGLPPVDGVTFSVICFVLLSLMLMAGVAIRKFKSSQRPKSYLLKFFLGG